LENPKEGSYGRVLPQEMRLAGEPAVAVDCAGGDKSDRPTLPVHHRVAVMRHPDSLLVKPKASDLGFPIGFLLQEARATDEPGFVGLGVGGKAGVPDPKLPRPGQLLAIQRQASFGS